MVTITIDHNLKDSAYEQVAGQIRRRIATGTLKPDKVMPSVRQLARYLGVNLNTVVRAYRVLKAEAFLVTKDRTDVSVAAPADRYEHWMLGLFYFYRDDPSLMIETRFDVGYTFN
jgi:DNA-binding transcriptional regulator YhcF (GntR family)|tara:strand:- start:280 stop:624 length:345 start_codon:yes stop_codon:yes gene_type:complete